MYATKILIQFSIFTFSYVFFVVSAANIRFKDVIGFEERVDKTQNRQPLYLPSVCPGNQLYYPGDQESDWICDCRPGHIYHPPTDTCWGVFRQGPCSEGEYLTLPTNSVLPICEKNPCAKDKFALWKGKCEILGSTKPCKHLYPVIAELGVNPITLSVDCVESNGHR